MVWNIRLWSAPLSQPEPSTSSIAGLVPYICVVGDRRHRPRHQRAVGRAEAVDEVVARPGVVAVARRRYRIAVAGVDAARPVNDEVLLPNVTSLKPPGAMAAAM